jgi:hypothetical protein
MKNSRLAALVTVLIFMVTWSGFVMNAQADLLVNLVKNPGFEDSGYESGRFEHWTTQSTVTIEESIVANSGKVACRAFDRVETWASPLQDMTEAFREWGPGVYEVSAYVKIDGEPASDEMMIVFNKSFDYDQSWFTVKGGINNQTFTKISGTIEFSYEFELVSSIIYLTSSTGTNYSFLCDDFFVAKANGIKEPVIPPAAPTPEPVPNRPEKTLVGAIRWDAWIHPDVPTFATPAEESHNYIGAQVSRILSPHYYHYRLPYFGIVESKDKVSLPHYAQEIFDDEMRYAMEAGIDYFMYCWYADGSGMDTARKFHEKSPHRTQVKMSAMWHITNLMTYSSENEIEKTLDHLKSDYWQMVADNRPLIYISDGDKQTLNAVNRFRKACEDAGIANPYLVGIEQFGSTPENVVQFGLDAYSDYAIGGTNGLPYASLAEKAGYQWNMDIRNVSQYIPLVPSGWDPRPRIETPTTWESPGQSMMAYIQTAAPIEIAWLLQKALEFNATHPEKTNINSVLIYSWNEHDEGGWLSPTIIDYDLDGMPVKRSDGTNARDTRRLQSIQKILRPDAFWTLDNDYEKYVPRTSIDGFIADADGVAVSGRIVQLYTDPLSTAITDETGYYNFRRIRAGEYTIAVMEDDGETPAGIFRIHAPGNGKTRMEITAIGAILTLDQTMQIDEDSFWETYGFVLAGIVIVIIILSASTGLHIRRNQKKKQKLKSEGDA